MFSVAEAYDYRDTANAFPYTVMEGDENETRANDYY